jgi:hypothetical protein
MTATRADDVSAFVSRWQQWHVEAETLIERLEHGVAEPAAPLLVSADAPGDAGRGGAMSGGASRRPSPAAPALAAALRQRFGISRATAYRAMKIAGGSLQL